MNFVGKGVVVLVEFVEQEIQGGRMLRSFKRRPENQTRSKSFYISSIKVEQ